MLLSFVVRTDKRELWRRLLLGEVGVSIGWRIDELTKSSRHRKAQK